MTGSAFTPLLLSLLLLVILYVVAKRHVIPTPRLDRILAGEEPRPHPRPYAPFDLIQTRNGVLVSVQASEYAYALPRNNTGPYSAVEVGLFTENVPNLFSLPYPTGMKAAYDGEFGNPERLGEKVQVFGYVPDNEVRRFLQNLGGERPD